MLPTLLLCLAAIGFLTHEPDPYRSSRRRLREMKRGRLVVDVRRWRS
jgi:hypothetical protein